MKKLFYFLLLIGLLTACCNANNTHICVNPRTIPADTVEVTYKYVCPGCKDTIGCPVLYSAVKDSYYTKHQHQNGRTSFLLGTPETETCDWCTHQKIQKTLYKIFVGFIFFFLGVLTIIIISAIISDIGDAISFSDLKKKIDDFIWSIKKKFL